MLSQLTVRDGIDNDIVTIAMNQSNEIGCQINTINGTITE